MAPGLRLARSGARLSAPLPAPVRATGARRVALAPRALQQQQPTAAAPQPVQQQQQQQQSQVQQAQPVQQQQQQPQVPQQAQVQPHSSSWYKSHFDLNIFHYCPWWLQPVPILLSGVVFFVAALILDNETPTFKAAVIAAGPVALYYVIALVVLPKQFQKFAVAYMRSHPELESAAVAPQPAASAAATAAAAQPQQQQQPQQQPQPQQQNQQ